MIERMIYQVELDSKPQQRTDLRVGWKKNLCTRKNKSIIPGDLTSAKYYSMWVMLCRVLFVRAAFYKDF